MVMFFFVIRILIAFIYGVLESEDVPPSISPSGNYEYRLQEGDTWVRVGLYDTAGNLLFFDDEKYYKRFDLIVEWQEDDDVLWICSGDVGLFCIIHEDGKWQKLPHGSEQIVGKPPRRIAKELSSLGLI